MTQHLKIPAGLLASICYSGGRRLSRITEYFTEEPHTLVNVGRSFGTGPMGLVTSPLVVPPTQLGNLGNEAYRFFKGFWNSQAGVCVCRGCFFSTTLQERSLHMMSCRAIIQAVFQLLRKDGLCVVCDTKTSKECWSVPLCSEACKDTWRFSIPESYKHAHALLMQREPTLLIDAQKKINEAHHA